MPIFPCGLDRIAGKSLPGPAIPSNGGGLIRASLWNLGS
jgi:hypothetical protein